MQQQIYSGAEYAQPSNPYVAADIHGSHGQPVGMQVPRQMHPSQVPSGYPAYALPGARLPMRGPGPPTGVQGQQYGGQHSALPMTQSPVSMQVYGPHNHNPVVAGPLPQRATPPVYASATRNIRPNYGQYHTPGFQTTEPSPRLTAAIRHPGSPAMAYRYPGYTSQSQGVPDPYRLPHQPTQTTYPTSYYSQQPEFHTNEGYGYYSQNNQYQRNIQGPRLPLNDVSRNQHCYRNPMNTINVSSHGQMHPNPCVNSNPVHGSIRGPVMNNEMQPRPQYPMYSQYNPQQTGMMPANPSSQMLMVNHGEITNTIPDHHGATRTQTHYFNNPETPTNTMQQQVYSSNPPSNPGNTAYLRNPHPSEQIHQNACATTQHSNMNQRASYPYTVRFVNHQQTSQQQYVNPQVPMVHQMNRPDMMPRMIRPEIPQSNPTCSNIETQQNSSQQPMSDTPQHIENIRDSIESSCSVTWEESPLAESGTESVQLQEDEIQEDTEVSSESHQPIKSNENVTNEKSCVSDSDNPTNDAETDNTNISTFTQITDNDKQPSPVLLIDEKVKEENVEINVHLTVSQNNQVQTIQCPSNQSSNRVPVEQTSTASLQIGFNNQCEDRSKEHVIVPWGWKRIFSSDIVIYLSPSNIELKSFDDLKEYLLRDGTCKCGLECPLELPKLFDFDTKKISVPVQVSHAAPNPSRYCSHRNNIAAMSAYENTPGIERKIHHIHNPIIPKKGVRKPRKKRVYANLMLTQQMVEAKEAEKRRINEIILQQKQEYEAQMSLSVSGRSSGFTVSRTCDEAGMNKMPAEREEQVQKQPLETFSQSLQSLPQHFSLPQPISQLKSQRLSQDSDKTDISQQSSERSDRIILESNDDEDEDDNEQDGIDNQSNSSDIKETYEQIKSKNIEIRRMSSTDEGDRVLHSAWDSPEKEKVGKTPLEMVQNIVSSIDFPSKEDKAENKGNLRNLVENATSLGGQEKTENISLTQQSSTDNSIPAWVQGPGKPLMHSQQLVANQTPPANISNALNQPTPQPPVSSASQAIATQQQQTTMMAGQIHSNTLASSIPIVSQSGGQVIFTSGTTQQQAMPNVQISQGMGQPSNQNTQPPIMQIVNTVNGPMLMQAFPAPTGITNINAMQQGPSNVTTFPTGGTVVIPTTNGQFISSIQPMSQRHQYSASATEMTTNEEGNENGSEETNEQKASKKKRKGKKKKTEPSSALKLETDNLPHYQPQVTISQPGQMPILVSQSMAPIQCTPNATNSSSMSANNQSHILNIGQTSSSPALMAASPSPQAVQPLIMNQTGGVLTNVGGQVLLSNGSFMAVPAIYNQQMPDGSIVQVQNGITQIPPPAMIQQTGQPMITGNGAGQIMMNPQGGGQFIPNGGTFIMTPQGLVPANTAGVQSSNQHHPGQSQTTFPQGNYVAINPAGSQNQPLQQITISPAHTPTLIQQHTPPPTQIPQHQQILTVQQQQQTAIASTSMSIKIDDNSDDDSVSMSPPSARSTPIPKKSKIKKSKKKKQLKDFRSNYKSSKALKIKRKEVEEEEDYENDEEEELKLEEHETEKIEDDDDSDVDGSPAAPAIDDDEMSDDDEVYASARSCTESSRSTSSGNNSMSSMKVSGKQNYQKRSKSSKGSKIFIQSNKVDSSGRKATPPHSADDKLSGSDIFSTSNREESLDISGTSYSSSGSATHNQPSSSRGTSRRRHHLGASSKLKKRKRNADILLQEELAQEETDDEEEEQHDSSLEVQEGFQDGELVWGPHGNFPSWPGKLIRSDCSTKVLVCWFGNKDTTQVDTETLKSLSDGLEAHHRERKKLRKGRKMNASLEKAIQEAMVELDRMADIE